MDPVRIKGIPCFALVVSIAYLLRPLYFKILDPSLLRGYFILPWTMCVDVLLEKFDLVQSLTGRKIRNYTLLNQSEITGTLESVF